MRLGRAFRLALLFALLVVASGAACAFCGATDIGRFDGPDGERAYRAAYAAGMARLPTPTRTADIVTTYGTVRVYEFGAARNGDDTPLLLLPGRSSGVPMWSSNLPGLAAQRRVIALDTLGDAGLSVQTRGIVDDYDQAAWIDEVLATLDVGRVHLVGHSFGGWLAANYALRHPQRVASLVLLEPVLVFAGLRWQFIAATIPASLSFLPRSWREAGLSYIGGQEDATDPSDPVARMIGLAAEHYRAALPLPEQPSDDELRRLPMPVSVAFAGRTVVHDPAAALARARLLVPAVEGRVWADATHSLPMEFPEQVNRELLTFVAAKR